VRVYRVGEADRFDGGLEDIFDLQNQVTAASVVGAIAPKLEQAEIEKGQKQADRASTPTTITCVGSQ
jgi:hypothetical protein